MGWRRRAGARSPMVAAGGGAEPHVNGLGPRVVDGRPVVAAGWASRGATIFASTVSTAAAPVAIPQLQAAGGEV
jgi:hypothetical protein